jgi:hypothetical protein
MAGEHRPRPTRLRVQHEWRSWPLWDVSDRDDVPHNIHASELPLPVELIEQLNAWSAEWDGQLDWNDPGGTVWDEQRLAELDRRGSALAEKVGAALPGVEVSFRNGPGRERLDD